MLQNVRCSIEMRSVFKMHYRMHVQCDKLKFNNKLIIGKYVLLKF